MLPGKLILCVPFLLLRMSSFSHPSDTARNIEVYFFLQTECPISQQYTPVIRAFHAIEEKKTDIKSIKIIFSTNKRNGLEQQVKIFMDKYNLHVPYQIDNHFRLAKSLHAKVTPEVFLLVDGKIKYHGAIDNMYARLGIKREVTTEFYLQEALEAIRNGIPLPYSHKEPMGCFIEY